MVKNEPAEGINASDTPVVNIHAVIGKGGIEIENNTQKLEAG